MASPSASSFFLLLLLPTILGMASAYSPVQICVRPCPIEVNLHLYLHQFVAGPNHPNRNEEFLIAPANAFGFGTTLIHDWTLTRTTDPNDTLVARVQGTHIQAGTTNANSWYISQNIVFQSGRFAGSTLQVMGTLTENSVGQWSIVGGTGQFTLAQGIINYKMDPSSNKDDAIRELNIRILYDADDVQVARDGALRLVQN
ncbi:dirigent protein 22-like [Lolium rigidum]|uniref:dirigent protein 22-like n=1 Tax=Lolium rigidum TaxID=89674 RepID=UPI001F5C5E4A|nr:dirigent protein 22-like [Lolium rigidum]